MTARRVKRVTETLADAAEELGGDAAKQPRRFADAAAADETYQELLARTLTIAQDTSMRDKRRALGRALANGLDDNGLGQPGKPESRDEALRQPATRHGRSDHGRC